MRYGLPKAMIGLQALLLWGGVAVGRMENAPPEPARNPVVVFDVWGYFESAGITNTQQRADIVYMLVSLQGIVNREQPRLYLLAALSLFDIESRYSAAPDPLGQPVTELDGWWLEWFQEKGWIDPASIVRPATLAGVLECFKDDIGGLVRWDASVGATLNAAFMAAGAEDLLPVSDSLAGGWLLAWFEKEFPGLAVRMDLSGVFRGKGERIELDGISFPGCGSAKNDVYRFAVERFMKRGMLDPGWMWYDIDASIWKTKEAWNGSFYGRERYERLGDRAHFQNNGFYNADFWVARRAVFLDLYPWDDSAPSDDPGQRIGEDFRTWNNILEWSYKKRKGRFGIVGGFIPWWVKYTKAQGNPHDPVPGEWRFIQLVTSYNMANDADAAFGIANASFFQHMPKVRRDQCRWSYPKPLKLERGTTYIAFMMMDYDGSAWLNQAAVSIYRDKARGRIPLNWCINPILNERVPHAFRYMVETRTDQDFFGIESDGTGYVCPLSLEGDHRLGRVRSDGFREFERFAARYRNRYGYTHTAFYISPRLDDPWLAMAARINPEGFGMNLSVSAGSVDGVPVFQLRDCHVSNVRNGNLERMLDEVYARSVAGKETRLQAWRCILLTPSHLVEMVEKMERKYPGAKVRIVDWPNLLQLKKQYLNL